jgi:hypothetical protein
MVTSKKSYLAKIRKYIPIRHLEVITNFILSLIVAAIIDFGFFSILIWLGQARLLDWTAIVSAMFSNVFIAVVLFYILGERRRSQEAESVNRMEAIKSFTHLKVYKFSVLEAPFYYVENKTTKQYYESPDFIEPMIKLGVIDTKECKNEVEMRELLEKNNVSRNDREPKLIELRDETVPESRKA